MAAAKSKPPNNKPASGIPARGLPASGMMASGPGWGGPAKGFVQFPQNSKQANKKKNKISNDMPPSEREQILARKKLIAERVAKLETIMFDIAEETTYEPNARLSAAARLHAIYEGQPVARVINHNTNEIGQLSDADLDGELNAIRERTAVATIEGEATEVSEE